MEHKQFLERLHQKTGQETPKMQNLLRTLLQLLGETLQLMRPITIIGFGTFTPHKKLEQVVENPTTGKRMLLPPKIVLQFTSAPVSGTLSPERVLQSRDAVFCNLLQQLSLKSRCTEEESAQFLFQFFNQIIEESVAGATITITGFGEFSAQWMENEDATTTPSHGHYELQFIPDQQMRDEVNAPFACFSPEELEDDAEIETPTPTPPQPEEMEGEIEEEKQEEENKEDQPTPATQPQLPTEEHHTTYHTHTVSRKELIKKLYKARMRSRYLAACALFLLLLSGASLYYAFHVQQRVEATPLYQPPVEQPVEAKKEERVEEEPLVTQEAPIQDTLLVETPSVQEILPTVTYDTIGKGEYLTTLSLRNYGHKSFWVYIFEANRQTLPNPNKISVGDVLVIPPKGDYPIDPNNREYIQKALSIAEELKQQFD